MTRSSWTFIPSRFALAAAFAAALAAFPFSYTVAGSQTLAEGARDVLGQDETNPASVDVIGSPEFQRYSEAAESNDLQEAGLALSEAADLPVTEDYVEEINEELGVQTSLTAKQIAYATNEGPLPY